MMMRSLHIVRTWLAGVLFVRLVDRHARFLPWLLVFMLILLVASYLPTILK